MSAFPCPKCNNERTNVIDTRVDFRRRKCPACAQTFFTQEVEIEPNWRKSPFAIKREEYKVRKDGN